MPTYEYRCGKCGHEFEREQRITEDPIKKCPECGSLQARRLISRTSFVLKGGGWYSDLYSGTGSKKKSDKSESKSESSSDKKSAPAKDSPGSGGGSKGSGSAAAA